MAKKTNNIDEERETSLRFCEAVRYLIYKQIVKNRKQFAESIGIPVEYFYKIESGLKKSVPNKYLTRMINLYNINGTWLLTGIGDIIDK